MSDFRTIAEQMRSDWDRRIRHDYRFWMSDGYADDQAMWEAGERDCNILLGDIPNTKQKSLLELGCGVGRILRATAQRFNRVVGIDVSAEAINKARELLSSYNNLELIAGNGVDLSQVPDQSIDVAMSFAALTSIPTSIIANYLRELNRVLIPAGDLRLQVYLGTATQVAEQDTLFLRCYEERNFRRAIEAAGFELLGVEELILPIPVSCKEDGFTAVITRLRKTDRVPASSEEISNMLLPGGEKRVSEWHGSQLEQFMTIKYAKELIAGGKRHEAEAAVRHALQITGETRFTVEKLLLEIEEEVAKEHAAQALSSTSVGSWDKNISILERKFPLVAEQVKATSDDSKVDSQPTSQGLVLLENGQCLDHPTKPVDGAKVWVERLLREKKYEKVTSISLFGFGAGYHVEEIQKRSAAKVSVIEPSVAAFKEALKVRDLSEVLEHIDRLYLGTGILPEAFESNSEFAIRPQTQSLYSDYCSEVRNRFYSSRGFTSLRPKIGVLGPIEGGTLPMVAYVSRSLGTLKQRGRPLDMSGFAGGFHNMSHFIREKERLNLMQNNYAEILSQLVIESVDENPVDILLCMAQAPLSARALLEMRKRGIITVLWFVEDYLRFGYWREMAKYYDFIFTIQKGECIDQIKRAGAGEVHYLPSGCDPAVHMPVSLSADERQRWGAPISFVGAGYYNRQQVFAAFAQLPFKIWGTEWPGCRPFDRLVQEGGRRISPEEYVKIFSATDININLHSSSERDGVDPTGDFINPRTFELAACGAFQLVDYRSHLAEVFEPGKEIAVFHSVRELREMIDHYLKHPEERIPFVTRARERALREHTYDHRIKSMLSTIYGSRYESLKQREDSSDWGRILSRAAKNPELKERCERAFERGEAAKLDGLVYDIVNGEGKLTQTEQKLLFLFHVKKQIINMKREEGG